MMSSTNEVESDRSWSIRGAADVVRSEISAREKVTTFQPVATRELVTTGTAGEPRRDWAAALDLVEEASEAIRLSAERVAELESAAEAQALQMREDLLLMQRQLQAAQREVTAAHERAEAAEAKAREAEAWLVKLDAAITRGFGSASARG